jgi:heat shock protein 4
MVGFDECRRVGEQATSGQSSNLKNTIKGMKRLVGLAFDDPRAQKEMKWYPGVTFAPFERSSGGTPSIGVKIHAGDSEKETVVPIEMVAGMMLRHMGDIAAAKAAEGTSTPASELFPQDWVVAIPNYFTDAQRRGLQAGCEIVGIKGVLRFMHENTATALSYGIFKDLKKEFDAEKPTNVMFIDMGASAYTVSIATFIPGQLIVKSAQCDSELGGRDFDMAVATWIASGFEQKFGSKLSGKPLDKPKTYLKILAAAEAAKKTLSPVGVKEARINLEMLMDDFDFSTSLKVEEYEAICQPLLDRLAGPIQKALEEAKLTSADLTAVEIVGGSTRIGCVKRKLLEILNIENLSTTMNADESVARGAALQSAILSPRFKVLPYDIQEAQPFPIKISWEGGDEDTSSVTMFNRGLTFPIVRRVTLKRGGPFSVKASYEDVEQYGLPAAAEEIATINIDNPTTADNKVRVNIKQDIHGILVISSAQMVEEIEDPEAEQPAAGGEAAADAPAEDGEGEKKKKIKKTNLTCSISRPLDWSADEINKYYEIEVAMANADRIVIETSNMRNELESYIYGMRDKISSDSQLGLFGTPEEKAAFAEKRDAMENWLYEDGFDATKKVYAEKLAELKALGDPIEKRQAESQERPGVVSSLQSSLESYTAWVNESQANEKYEHVTDEEREKVRSKCDEISAWMYEKLDQQAGMSLDEDPVLTVHSIRMKHKELADVCSPVINKPKPKPKPKEEPQKETPPTPEPSEDGKKEEEVPMEGVETEEKTEEKMQTD